MSTLQVVLSALCALLALVLVLDMVRDRLPGNAELLGLSLVELGLVVQLVLGLVDVANDHRGVSVATYVGYLVGALFILPIGYLWSASERNRSGTGVLLVAVLVVPVLCLRLHDIWLSHV